jgi:hypothetical protein
VSAGLSAAGSDLDDVVSRGDGRPVVLDHQHGTGERRDRIEQPLEIGVVQSDRRLVQDVQEIFELPGEDDRQTGALRFSSRQRRHRTVEREVVQTEL